MTLKRQCKTSTLYFTFHFQSLDPRHSNKHSHNRKTNQFSGQVWESEHDERQIIHSDQAIMKQVECWCLGDTMAMFYTSQLLITWMPQFFVLGQWPMLKVRGHFISFCGVVCNLRSLCPTDSFDFLTLYIYIWIYMVIDCRRWDLHPHICLT